MVCYFCRRNHAGINGDFIYLTIEEPACPDCGVSAADDEVADSGRRVAAPDETGIGAVDPVAIREWITTTDGSFIIRDDQVGPYSRGNSRAIFRIVLKRGHGISCRRIAVPV